MRANLPCIDMNTPENYWCACIYIYIYKCIGFACDILALESLRPVLALFP